MLLFWILMIVFVGIAVIVGVVKFKETKSMAADGKTENQCFGKMLNCLPQLPHMSSSKVP